TREVDLRYRLRETSVQVLTPNEIEHRSTRIGVREDGPCRQLVTVGERHRRDTSIADTDVVDGCARDDLRTGRLRATHERLRHPAHPSANVAVCTQLTIESPESMVREDVGGSG